jgi:hypothetical protein
MPSRRVTSLRISLRDAILKPRKYPRPSIVLLSCSVICVSFRILFSLLTQFSLHCKFLHQKRRMNPCKHRQCTSIVRHAHSLCYPPFVPLSSLDQTFFPRISSSATSSVFAIPPLSAGDVPYLSRVRYRLSRTSRRPTLPNCPNSRSPQCHCPTSRSPDMGSITDDIHACGADCNCPSTDGPSLDTLPPGTHFSNASSDCDFEPIGHADSVRRIAHVTGIIPHERS